MRFSQQEVRDLLIAWVMISIAFGILFRDQTTFLTAILISAVTAGIGFLLHELAHKAVAQRMGKFAEFHAYLPTLVISVVLAFTGLVVAAPGAVVISGFVNRRENGLISAAGPLTNIALAVIFLLLLLLSPLHSLLAIIAGMGFVINSWLALFNLIPFGIFDGAKIIQWNKAFFSAMAVASVVLVFFSAILHP